MWCDDKLTVNTTKVNILTNITSPKLYPSYFTDIWQQLQLHLLQDKTFCSLFIYFVLSAYGVTDKPINVQLWLLQTVNSHSVNVNSVIYRFFTQDFASWLTIFCCCLRRTTSSEYLRTSRYYRNTRTPSDQSRSGIADVSFDIKIFYMWTTSSLNIQETGNDPSHHLIQCRKFTTQDKDPRQVCSHFLFFLISYFNVMFLKMKQKES